MGVESATPNATIFTTLCEPIRKQLVKPNILQHILQSRGEEFALQHVHNDCRQLFGFLSVYTVTRHKMKLTIFHLNVYSQLE